MNIIPKAEAHVLYIATPEDVVQYSGNDAHTLVEPFTHASNVFIMVFIAIMAGLIILLFQKTPTFREKIHRVAMRAMSYADLVPWIMRLSLGILLISSGVHGTLLSPTLTGYEIFSFAQIVFGFLLLSGFLTTFAILGANLIFFMALSQSFYMLGSLEFLAMSLALLVFDARRPGIDHLFNIPALHFSQWKKWIPVIVRVGLGTSFVFLAVYEKFLNPDLAMRVVDVTHLTSVINFSPAMWVVGTGLVEIAIGLMFLFGFAVRAAAAVAFVILTLSFFYFGEDVTSHITIFGALSVLFILGGKKVRF